MNGVSIDFTERLDVFNLNWDDSSLDQIRLDLEITGRSQYVLLGPDGEVLRRWFGPLNPTLADEIEAILMDAGF